MSEIAANEAAAQRPQRRFDATAWMRDYSMIVIVVAVFIVMSVLAPNFLSVSNLMNLLDANAPLMLVALGTTFVIIAGCFDLSTGQILSLCGVLGPYFALKTGSPVVGIVLAVAVGIPLGALNGALVSLFKVSSFLATLATGLVFGGLALLVTNGTSIDLSSNTAYTWLGNHRVGAIPMSVIICAVAFVVLWVILSKTVLGRQVYAVGSNAAAARLSGISGVKVILAVFAIGGLLAAIAGVITTARTGVGNTYGPAGTITLNAIAAVVIGGTSISGGRGAVWRTVFGVLLLAMLQNAFNLLSFDQYWQQIVSGFVILVAIVLNTTTARSG